MATGKWTAFYAASCMDGADVAGVVPLQANCRTSNRGFELAGSGFIVTPDEARQLGLGSVPGLEQHIRLTPEALAACFKRSRPDRIADLLEPLVIVGQARKLLDGRFTG